MTAVVPANESEGNIELPLVAAAVLAARPVQVLGEVDEARQLLQLRGDPVLRASQSADPRKEGQHLSASQHLDMRDMRTKTSSKMTTMTWQNDEHLNDGVKLGAVANALQVARSISTQALVSDECFSAASKQLT